MRRLRGRNGCTMITGVVIVQSRSKNAKNGQSGEYFARITPGLSRHRRDPRDRQCGCQNKGNEFTVLFRAHVLCHVETFPSLFCPGLAGLQLVTAGRGPLQIMPLSQSPCCKACDLSWPGRLKTGNITPLLSNNRCLNPLLLLNISPMKRRVRA